MLSWLKRRVFETQESLYKEVPYEPYPTSQAHPNLLWAWARWSGIHVSKPANSKILEIGCGAGGTIIPLAWFFPESICCGYDLSEDELRRCKLLIKKTGIKNLTLKKCDILDFPETNNTWDYIIVHGVYSWIDTKRQKHLLDFIRKALAPQGVCYLSYNLLPGWYEKLAVRQIVVDYCNASLDKSLCVREQIIEVRKMLKRYAACLQDVGEANFLNRISLLSELEEVPDWYFLHEFMGEYNEPLSRIEFSSRAFESGLSTIGDADFLINLPDAECDYIFQRTNGINIGDYTAMRTLARALLIRSDALKRVGDTRDFFTQTHLAFNGVKKITGRIMPMEFFVPKRGKINIEDEDLISVLTDLSEFWPRTVQFEDLSKEYTDRGTFLSGLSNLFLRGMLHVEPNSSLAASLCDTPEISLLSRMQAEIGDIITGYRLDYLKLDTPSASLIELLNGRSSLDEIKVILKDISFNIIDENEQERQFNFSHLGEDQLTDYCNSVLGECEKRGLLVTFPIT